MGNAVKIYAAGFLFLLGACTGPKEMAIEPHVTTSQYESVFGYKITPPTGYSYAENAPSGKYYYFGYPANSTVGIRTVELHEIHFPCSPSLTGASEMEPLDSTNGKAKWGKVDGWDNLNFESGDGAYGALRNVVCRKEGTPPPTSVYALCSEKDGKTVVICISQMTDNPKQAQEIFETFRWSR